MLDQKLLETMVLKAIERLETENVIRQSPKKACFILLPEYWQEKYFDILGRVCIPPDVQITFVLPRTLCNDYYIKHLKELFPGSLVCGQEQGEEKQPDEFVTVFPFPDRALIAKIALGISDTFETRWIVHCFSKGLKSIFLRDGIEPFSGREPKAYRSKIEEYIRTLADFGIEISDCIPAVQPRCEPASRPQQTEQRRKRVITEADLAACLTEKKLLLFPGDIITMLAREKAGELGISIIRTAGNSTGNGVAK